MRGRRRAVRGRHHPGGAAWAADAADGQVDTTSVRSDVRSVQRMPTRSRLLRIALAVVVLASIVGTARVAIVSARPLSGGTTIAEQATFLQGAIDRGADGDMQRLFPEGRLFMHALTAHATLSGSGRPDVTTDRGRSTIRDARANLAAVDGEGSRFGRQASTAHGIFHAGWRLAVATELASATGRQHDVERVRTWSAEVASALTGPDGPFPTSYPGRRWPVDAVAAAAALVDADALLDDVDHSAALRAWFERAQDATDDDLDLLPHEVSGDGEALEGPRGSSQALVQVFWHDVARAVDGRADEAAWSAFTEAFVVRRVGLVGVLEHPVGTSGRGDVDSGPLVAGVSLSASVVAMAAARRVGDRELATALDRQVELVGLPWTWSTGRRFACGLLPIGDAFVAWSRSHELATTPVSQAQRPLPSWWVVTGTVALPGLFAGLALVVLRRRRVDADGGTTLGHRVRHARRRPYRHRADPVPGPAR